MPIHPNRDPVAELRLLVGFAAGRADEAEANAVAASAASDPDDKARFARNKAICDAVNTIIIDEMLTPAGFNQATMLAGRNELAVTEQQAAGVMAALKDTYGSDSGAVLRDRAVTEAESRHPRPAGPNPAPSPADIPAAAEGANQ